MWAKKIVAAVVLLVVVEKSRAQTINQDGFIRSSGTSCAAGQVVSGPGTCSTLPGTGACIAGQAVTAIYADGGAATCAAFGSSTAANGVFGDGVDGTTFNADGGVCCGTANANCTLKRDILCTSIDTGTNTIKTANFKMFASVSITVKDGGIISNNGNNANGSTGGLAVPVGSLLSGWNGTNGNTSTGGPGASCTSSSPIAGVGYGGIGGAGGTGVAAGGAGGNLSACLNTANQQSIHFLPTALQGYVPHSLAAQTSLDFNGGGSGGGSGGGDNVSGNGGGSGAGAGMMILASPTITVGVGGAITAFGGNGGSGSPTKTGGGGGGGGGVMILVYRTLANNGFIGVDGGNGGGGVDGGTNGSVGNAGQIIQFLN